MVVVTGADGQLGQALVRSLVSVGTKVRILLRDIHSPGFDGLPVERMAANILDPASLIHAFAGAELVYHCDIYLTLLPYNYPKMFKHNVRGTDMVIYACRMCGVRRLVYVSSMLAFGFDWRSRMLHEGLGFRPQKTTTYFGKTMAITSQRVVQVAHTGIETVVLCPAAMVGPYDYDFSLLGKLIWDFGRGRVHADARGGLDLIDNRDLARVCLWAADKAASGAMYLVSGGHMNMERLMRNLQKITGKRRPWIHLPRWILYILCIAYEVLSVFQGGHPIYTRAASVLVRSNQRVFSTKLRDDMGFEPIPLNRSLSDAWSWLREHHHSV